MEGTNYIEGRWIQIKQSLVAAVNEEEMRASLDPKYAHLSDDLHVEIAAFAPPAEAHARIAYALAELRKYLIPDANDEIRQEQMREMELIQTDPSVGVVGPNGTTQIGVRKPIRGGMRGRGGVGLRGAPALRGGGIPSLRGGGRGLLSPPGSLLPPRGGLPPSGVRKPMPPPQALLPRPIPTKTKVLSILDRARVAMEESYAMGEDDMGGGGFYDSSYNSYNATGYGSYEDYDEGTADYYDTTESYPGWSTEKYPASYIEQAPHSELEELNPLHPVLCFRQSVHLLILHVTIWVEGD
uniref:Uncharacterized protein n=1 Tax=Timema tahoe TaxID=61484 RepID=A0A7R9IPY0_9NEOP|nr:unnamed protein product [Timema tahoe]